MRKYVIEKLREFSEEQYSIQLVVFDAVLEHIIRIDRVLRQPIGHMLLVGASGVGKTTLSRFVSWMNGLEVFQTQLSFPQRRSPRSRRGSFWTRARVPCSTV